MVPSHMRQNDRRFGRFFCQTRELLRQAEGLVAGVEEDRGIEFDRFLDQPYNRAVVGCRRNAFLGDLQTLHPQIENRFLQ